MLQITFFAESAIAGRRNGHTAHRSYRFPLIIGMCLGFFWCSQLSATENRAPSRNGLRKLDDIVIYEDAKFYAAFPSIVRRPNGDLLVAFSASAGAPDVR